MPVKILITDIPVTFYPFLLLILTLLIRYSGSGVVCLGKRIPWWVVTLSLSLCVAWLAELVTLSSLLLLVLLTAAVYFYGRLEVRWHNELLYAVTLIVSYLILMRIMPGFASLVVYQNHIFGENIFPHSLMLHYGKAFVGILIFCVLSRRVQSWHQLWLGLIAVKWVPLLLAGYFALGMALWYVPDVKFESQLVVFLISNLFFIVVVEEAFFRALVQEKLEHLLGGDDLESRYLAAVITTVFFSLSYYINGITIEEAILTFIAGMIYAFVYGQTRLVEVSILFHFAVNGIRVSYFLFP